MTAFGKILRPFFGVSQKTATSFSPGDVQAAQRLETVISTVTKGCQVTLQNSRVESLVPRLNVVEAELRGYAYEGAGVGLAALDCILPWKNRTRDFLEGPGAPYIYAVHIGAGLGLARLKRHPEPFLKRLDPVLGWIALDGYGFHEGFFSRRKYVEQQKVPAHLSAFGLRCFDHGVGRAIWFLVGGNMDQIAPKIGAFPMTRQADLWSGIGLACGYTGGVERAAIEMLRTAAGPYLPDLAVGVAIGANARHRAGSPARYAELACEIVCGTSSDSASKVVERAFQNLPTNRNAVDPAYGIWRQRIAAALTALSPARSLA